MAILIQQDYAVARDERGMRGRVRPQDIKSGTYYGQLQLRGSILVIKDAQDAASGYIAYGTDMTTIPTSSSTGTGVYQDYSGIYGLSGGTKQFYWTSADGKGYAGAGAVTIDEDGISITQGNNDYNIVKWTHNGTSFLGIGGSYFAGSRDILDSSFNLHTDETNSEATAGFTVITGTGGTTPDIRFYLNVNGSTVASPTYGSANDAWARLYSDDGTFLGLLIGEGNTANDWQPEALLHLHSTAPSLLFDDITASAKKLLITVDANLATFEEAGGTDILVMDLTNAAVYLSDTSNANMTIGLTINQGANDNQIFALKSSDVAHGVTTLAETDTFGYITKFSGTDGGVSFVGLNDTAAVGVRIAGVATTANTTHTTGGLGAVIIDGFLKSGTGVASLGADANILAVRDNGTTRFMLDADGDSHQDVGTAWTNFDEHDDLALLNLMSAHVTRQDDPLREHFSAWLEQSRDDLERLKLVTFNADGHHFINWSRMQMLQVGALRQIGERLERLEREHHH